MELNSIPACHGRFTRSDIDLERGLREQCRLCEVISLGFSAYCRYHSIKGYKKLVGEHCSISPSGTDRTELYMRDVANKEHWLFLRSDEDSTYFNYGQDALGNYRSPPDVPHGRLHQAKVWMQDCVGKHTTCSSKQGTEYPRRVLHIHEDKKMLRLVEGLKPGQATMYACLSHCWGPSQPVRTLKGNIFEHCSAGIRFDQLPQTFFDFVKTCIFLEIRYAWIDSLCIVQDDEDDWFDQAGRMASIYGNALVTVAATRAAGCQQGFLAGPYVDEILHVRDKRGQGWSITGEADDSLWHFKNAYPDKAMPLNRRAWTFQESFLSPRSLMFGTQELAWECRQRFSCHQHGEDLHERRDKWGKSLMEQHLYALPQDTSEITKSNGVKMCKFFETWIDLLQNYVSRRLSFDKDRLVALAGVMDTITRRTGRKCYAGHWDTCFLESLAWWVSNGRRPAMRRAPSWSWASMETGDGLWDCQRSKFDVESVITAKVISVDCPSIGGLHTDDEISTLMLDAWLVPVLLRRAESASKLNESISGFEDWCTDSVPADIIMDTSHGHGKDAFEAYAVVLGTAFISLAILCRRAKFGQDIFYRIGLLEFKDRDPTDVIQASGKRRRVSLV